MIRLPEKHREVLIKPCAGVWKDLIRENRKNSKRLKPWRVGCGHECSLFHPGVLFKEIVVSRFDSAGKANVSCDTEIPKNRYFKFPEDGVCENIKYFDGPAKIPYCMHNSFSGEGINEIKKKVSTNTQSVRYFETVLNVNNGVKNLAELTTRTKEVFLQSFGFSLPQIYLSKLLETEMYKEFYRRIVDSKHEFIEIYNQGLQKMPYQTGIKRLDEDELPFWERKGIPLPVPKAIPLSIFLRLYVFDLYIEGVGGSRYSPAADFIIENFFKEHIPLTAVVSATIWYGQKKKKDLMDNIREIENTIRRMEENPQEFTGDSADTTEINVLIDSLNKTGARDSVYRIIKKKKGQIRKKIENEIKEKKNGAKRLKNTVKIVSREYPFFVYPEEDLRYLFEVKL